MRPPEADCKRVRARKSSIGAEPGAPDPTCRHPEGAEAKGGERESMTTNAHSVEVEIEQAANAWMQAAARRDVESLDRTLAVEFSMVTNRGTEIDRSEWLDNMLHRVGPEFTPPEFLNVRVRVYGDTAVMASRNQLRATFDGKDCSGHLALTDVWVRRDGRWQLVRRHATNLEAGAT